MRPPRHYAGAHVSKDQIRMLKKKLKTDAPCFIRVGDIYVAIVKIGDRILDVSVDAPRDLPITFGVHGGEITPETIETEGRK